MALADFKEAARRFLAEFRKAWPAKTQPDTLISRVTTLEKAL